MKFLRVDPERAFELSMRLADMIIESGYRPTLLVPILRGGMVVARLLSDLLDVHKVKAIRITHYAALEVKDIVEVTEPLNTRVDGEKVLLVDDVADTGDSLLVAIQHVKDMGASEVKVATLHFKPWSKVRPDYYVEETDAWVVYFWEYAETVRYLSRKLKAEGMNEKEIEHIILNEAGVPKVIIDWVRANAADL